ncbi:hypothetical protein [Mobiluncus mulieris]|uniref:hypothetical protein n=1 Tax=Mobiluncus mulieris TaxID=2052 RepID=UPI0015F076D2|nr:hypothetical protein [Mobiluncus mulieris]
MKHQRKTKKNQHFLSTKPQTGSGKTQTAPGKNFDTDKNGLFPRRMPGKQAHNILLSGMAPHETKPKPKPKSYFIL